VKTLHPKVHGDSWPGWICGAPKGSAGQRHSTHPDRLRQPLPFQETIAKGDASVEEAIENIDIGGPACSGAAKNHEHVTVLIDPQTTQRS